MDKGYSFMNPLFTIIIPHKCIPKLLERCLNSIPVRRDVQVIVVDDNSDPSKEVVYPELVEAYPHVQWVWAKNEGGRRGAGYARNLGMKQAAGRWLLFADADDIYTNEFLSILDAYADSDADIVYFYPTSVDTCGIQLGTRHISYETILEEARKKEDNSLLLKMYTPTCKLIKHGLVSTHGIQFSETLVTNDVLFSTMCQRFSEREIIDSRIGYCITTRSGSLHTKRDVQSARERFFIHCQAMNFLRETGEEAYRRDGSPFSRYLAILVYHPIAAIRLFPEFMTTINMYGIAASVRHIISPIKKRWMLYFVTPVKKHFRINSRVTHIRNESTEIRTESEVPEG